MNKKFKICFIALLCAVILAIPTVKSADRNVETNGYGESASNQSTVVLSSKTSNESKDISKDIKKSPSRGGLSINKTNEIVKKSSENQKKLEATTSNSLQAVDWWNKGRYVFAIGIVVEVQDFYTGKKFKIKRTMGENHADVEALTKEDTEIIKSIWGGFSWERRPVILNINGERYAASMSAMPHAGLDASAAYVTVNNRSGGFGRGQNLDVIKGNGMDGHMDIHFLNSTRHKDGKVDTQHQNAIAKLISK